MHGPRDLDENPESSYIKAKNAALRLLSYRSRSEKEVQRRLEGRFTQEAVDCTLFDPVSYTHLRAHET